MVGRRRLEVSLPSATAVPAVTDEQIAVIYEKLLGRPVENWELALHRGAASFADFLATVAQSPEYRLRAKGRLPQGSAHVNVWAPELSEFHLAPGTISHDGVAEVADDGVLLVNEGRNAPGRQLDGSFVLPDGWAAEWAAVHRRRTAWAKEQGVDLLWLMIPDKSVFYATARGDFVAARRPVHRLVDEIGIPLLYPLELLHALPAQPYLRADSHLTTVGVRALACAVTAAAGAPEPPRQDVFPCEQYFVEGDIGGRFSQPLHDVRTLRAGCPYDVVESNFELVRSSGRHLTTRMLLRNPDAPDPRTCVIFGDSFAFPGVADRPSGYHLQGLSWWLAQVFRELHFVWAPFGWDADCLRMAAPDLVLCEGAERFAVEAPADDIETLTSRRPGVSDPSALPRSAPSPGAVSAEEVIALYDKLVGRHPLPTEVALQMTARSLGELVDVVLAAPEHHARQRALLAQTEPPFPNIWTPQLARFARPPGTVSADGTAEVGQGGVLLPLGRLRAADTEPRLRAGWSRAVRQAWSARAEECARVDARLVGMVVPCKAACEGLRHGVAPTDDRPVRRLLAKALPFRVLYPIEGLAELAERAFPPTDSRPSAEGHRLLAGAILHEVDGPALPEPAALATRTMFVRGDLGMRFRPGLGDLRPELGRWPCEVESTGEDVVIRNPEAPDGRACLVFGDSTWFSDEAPGAEGLGVAWWLALAFREVHLVLGAFGWSGRRVQDLAPDVVVVEGSEARCAELAAADHRQAEATPASPTA